MSPTPDMKRLREAAAEARAMFDSLTDHEKNEAGFRRLARLAYHELLPLLDRLEALEAENAQLRRVEEAARKYALAALRDLDEGGEHG
jgi:hypothetical protein